MINPITNFKINNFKVLHKIKFKKNNKVPYIEKQQDVYMSDMFLEPEHRNSSQSGLFDLFNNLFSSQTDNREEKNEENKPIYESKTNNIQENLYETKKEILEEELEKKEDYEPYPIFKDLEPPHNRNIIQTIAGKFSEVLSIIGSSLSYFKDNVFDIKDNIIYNIENKKRIAKSNKLLYARNDFKNKLQKYKDMFNDDDIIPDLSEFSKYRYVSLAELNQLSLVLDACIKHQKAINKLKNRYRKGAGRFSSNNDDNNIKADRLIELPADIVRKSNISRQELISLFNIYTKNSKKIELPIKSFNNISKRFFKCTKSNMEEIFEYKKKWWSIFGEKIPKLGIIPKSVRVIGQINLTRQIMKDYKEITHKYIKEGTNPLVKHYGEQYNTIEACVDRYKSTETSPKNLEFVNRLSRVMKNLREDRVSTYAKMYDNFARAGCNISNFCNNVRLKGGVSLGLKTLFTFFSPF